ncbi:MAG: Crp/Fnr family transcriptional regulator [Chamaesiphon sp.]
MYTTFKATLDIDQYEANEGRRLHLYKKGEVIPLLPQGVWQVYQGLVQLSTLCPNGEQILLGWAGSSTFFGLWLTMLQVYQATALSDVSVRWFSLTEIENSPRLSQALLPQLTKRMRQTEALLAISGQRRVEDRLQRLLLLLKQEIGEAVAEGTCLSVRLTHQNIANAIGTTRVTITRLLKNLQHQGWISFSRERHIILKDDKWVNLDY